MPSLEIARCLGRVLGSGPYEELEGDAYMGQCPHATRTLSAGEPAMLFGQLQHKQCNCRMSPDAESYTSTQYCSFG